MKKVVLPGLLVGLVMLAVSVVVGQLFHLLFPLLASEYMTSLFRPWTDPIMSLFFVVPFLLGLALAFIWLKVRRLFKGSIWQKGSTFGFMYWLVTIPGMVMTYASFPVSLLMVLSWTITILLQALCAGWVLAKVVK